VTRLRHRRSLMRPRAV